MQDIYTILISGGISLLVMYLGLIANRKKHKAETESLVVNGMRTYIDTIQKEREFDRQIINENRALIKQQQRENEECEYKHEVTELELEQVKKKIDYQSWQKETVFILDDNQMVINEFKFRFGKISVLDYRAFSDSDMFLVAAQKEQPEILILDYLLEGGKTAEDVISKLGYEPKIIIMSADKSIQPKFIAKGIQFFYKDEHYVLKIAKAVIQHLHDKN